MWTSNWHYSALGTNFYSCIWNLPCSFNENVETFEAKAHETRWNRNANVQENIQHFLIQKHFPLLRRMFVNYILALSVILLNTAKIKFFCRSKHLNQIKSEWTVWNFKPEQDFWCLPIRNKFLFEANLLSSNQKIGLFVSIQHDTIHIFVDKCMPGKLVWYLCLLSGNWGTAQVKFRAWQISSVRERQRQCWVSMKV